MTIAKRLIILLAVPLLILIGIGVVTRQQLVQIEERTRFVAESRVVAIARLGDISRSFAEMRVNVRSFLLATNQAAQARALSLFDGDLADLNRLLVDYADNRVSSDQGRRMVNDFRTLSRDWTVGANQVMSLAVAGRKSEANGLLSGSVAALGGKLSKASSEWISENETAATMPGQIALDTIESSRRNLLIAVGIGLRLSGVLGFVTFRRIMRPIRALETSVKCIAGGDYTQAVPFTQAADETGELVGQCGMERKPIVLADLPPGYCRIASGLGQAPPSQANAWPLMSQDTLLAEGNEINQQIAVELLEGVGAHMTVANNGQEAVERLIREPAAYDLVLMDLQMPVMGGHESTVRIRSDARFAKLPIIAMTAHATIEGLEANRSLFASFLTVEEFSRFEQEVQGYAFGEAGLRLQQAVNDKGILLE